MRKIGNSMIDDDIDDNPMMPVDLARRRVRKMESGNVSPVPLENPTPNVCDIKEIDTGKIVPYRMPPGVTAPGGAPSDAIISELREIARLIYNQSKQLEKIESYLSYKTPTSNWLEFQVTTTIATPGAIGAITQDTITVGANPGYNTVDVYTNLQGRNAQRVWLVNDGVSEGKGDNLYVRTSPDGQSFSPEFIMLLGEIRIVSDVYEIRFRSPTINVTLRGSEREIYPPYVTSVENTFTTTGTLNRSNFIARSVAVPNPALLPPNNQTILPNITIPDGFSVTIIANINNVGQIYLSRTDATNANVRTTLAAGDVRTLFVTNTNLFFVAGSIAGQFVDIVAEQA